MAWAIGAGRKMRQDSLCVDSRKQHSTRQVEEHVSPPPNPLEDSVLTVGTHALRTEIRRYACIAHTLQKTAIPFETPYTSE